MPSTIDLFQQLFEKEDTNQPPKEMDAQIDRKAAWKTVSEWLGCQAKSASEKLNIIARKQDEPIGCEEADQTQEFLAPPLRLHSNKKWVTSPSVKLIFMD